jgi:hypothetical protein
MFDGRGQGRVGLKSLEDSIARVQARLATKHASAVISERPEVAQPRRGGATKPRPRIGASAQRELFDLASDDRWESRLIRPENEYPRELTRWPIFLPGNRESQKRLLDKDNALPFATSWGRGRRFGGPLTTYDEDTLIALTRMRQIELRGHGPTLPIAQSGGDPSESQSVQGVYCLISDIDSVLGYAKGGMSTKMRHESLKRLTGTRIELEAEAATATGIRGGTFTLIDIAWELFKDDGLIYAQFPPVMTRLLNESYSYLDFAVRRELADTGKAVHRFLSGQPRSYAIGAEKLRKTIGYVRPAAAFMRELRETMGRLQSVGWIRAWTIEGTGRSHPFVLQLER